MPNERIEPAPTNAEVATPTAPAHPDEVAREIINYANSCGFQISADGFTLLQQVGNMVASHRYSMAGAN